MILFFDTETTGKADFRMPPSHECQPHLCQLAALLTDDSGVERASISLVVRPAIPIPAEAAAIHGITDEVATRFGVTERTATGMFNFLASRADTLVAHNVDFDQHVIEAAFCRSEAALPPVASRFCTMRAATPICKIPHANPRHEHDYKWPRLEECMRIFFGEELAGAHDALVDVRACARVYFHLKSMENAS